MEFKTKNINTCNYIGQWPFKEDLIKICSRTSASSLKAFYLLHGQSLLIRMWIVYSW